METPEETESNPPAEPKRSWFDPVSAVLMGVASLATAWCSFQFSRWSGESANFRAQSDKLERHAIARRLEAQQIQAFQVQIFTEAINARLEGKEELERAYAGRIGAELKPAYDRWLALRPFENPDAPPHPFVPGLYKSRFEDEIQDAQVGALRVAKDASAAGKHAGDYQGNTVVLATVLFFTGTAGKFDRRRVRHGSLIFAAALFAYAVVLIAKLPVI